MTDYVRSISGSDFTFDDTDSRRVGPSDGNDIHRLPLQALLPADSPRLSGEDPQHARMLAESEGELPPVLVHRSTMRVIDGMHRVLAAGLNGAETIAVRYFDGDPEEAFVAAVQSNVAHGLPLSLADREAAASRVLRAFPHRSDRSIAAVTGISAATVAGLRRRVCPDGTSGAPRMGRDGRLRPLSSAEGRRVAEEVITSRPNASLREVARAAGISPATVRDVRDRIARGDDPVPEGLRGLRPGREIGARPAHQVSRVAPAGIRDYSSLLQNLRKDPSLRFTDSGRELLRWLFSRVRGPEGWEELVTAIPQHSTYVVAEVARSCAREWAEFAEELERRVRSAG